MLALAFYKDCFTEQQARGNNPCQAGTGDCLDLKARPHSPLKVIDDARLKIVKIAKHGPILPSGQVDHGGTVYRLKSQDYKARPHCPFILAIPVVRPL